MKKILFAFALFASIPSNAAIIRANFIPTDPSVAVSTSGWVKTGSAVHPATLTDKVGIGTASPNSRVHISNDSGSAVKALNIVQNNGGSWGLLVQSAFFGSKFACETGDSGTERVLSVQGSGSTSILETQCSGNVGVGTSSPAEKLDVAGGIGFYVRTKAQLEAITPGKAGTAYYCSDCLNSVNMVISTGATISGFDSFGIGGTLWH